MIRSQSLATPLAGAPLSLACATTAVAQAPRLVESGTRLRITLFHSAGHGAPSSFVGEFVEAGRRDVAIRRADRQIIRVEFDSIATLERSIDRSRHPVAIAAGGAFIGAVIGLFVGPKKATVVIPGRDPSTCPVQPNTNPACAYETRARLSPLGAGYGAMIGGGIGFAFGTMVRFDTWSGLSPDALPRRVSLITPGARDRRVGLSISF